MLSDSNISKGGIIGAVAGLAASFFLHKSSNSTSNKAVKTGLFSAVGYFIGSFVEKKIKEKKQ